MGRESIITDRVPYVRTGDGPIAIFKSILLQMQNVQRIDVDLRLPYMRVERIATPEELLNHSTDPDGVKVYNWVRDNVQLAEFAGDDQLTAHEQLFEMFAMLADEGLVPSHLLVGSLDQLRKWVKFPRRHTSLLGVPLYQLEQVPSSTIILCGALRRDIDAEDVQFAVKGIIE